MSLSSSPVKTTFVKLTYAGSWQTASWIAARAEKVLKHPKTRVLIAPGRDQGTLVYVEAASAADVQRAEIFAFGVTVGQNAENRDLRS